MEYFLFLLINLVIAKDHIQRQFISLLIMKRLNTSSMSAVLDQPNNKYYWQFKCQQLSERNISLQQQIAQTQTESQLMSTLLHSDSMKQFCENLDNINQLLQKLINSSSHGESYRQKFHDIIQQLQDLSQEFPPICSEREHKLFSQLLGMLHY